MSPQAMGLALTWATQAEARRGQSEGIVLEVPSDLMLLERLLGSCSCSRVDVCGPALTADALLS